MEHRGRVYLLGSLFGGAALLALGCWLLMLLRLPMLELNAARGRWASRPFTHYRMDLKYGELGYCRQSVEVQGQRVIAILENTCSEPVPTVDELFDRIER